MIGTLLKFNSINQIAKLRINLKLSLLNLLKLYVNNDKK